MDVMDGPDSWLELLENQRPAREFEAFRRALAERGDPGAQDGEYERAIRLHERLVEHKQHADYLTVLNDLARRLTAMHNPDDVLQEVAVQARRLLGLDVAYIMLVRSDGFLRIEVTDGSIGTALRGIELASGSGLGGEVLRTGRPMWSENYLSDPSFPHASALDDVATSELLGGIITVPLIVGENTIGVLCAADRKPRHFSERDVEMLAALAAHAAVAIRNARLFEQHRVAVEELRKANQTLACTAAMRQRAGEVAETLTGVILGGGGLGDIAQHLARATGSQVSVLDSEGLVVAGDQGSPAPPPDLRVAAVREASGPVRSGDATTIFAPVVLRDGYAGCIVSWGRGLDDEAAALLAIGASSVGLVIASERSIAEAELRTRGEFASALLSSDADEATIRRRARAARVDLNKIRTVVVIAPGLDDRGDSSRLGLRVAADLGSWTAEYASQIVLLVPDIEASEVHRRLTRNAEDGLPGTAGIASTTGGVVDIRAAHDRARQTVAVLLALGRAGSCVQDSALGVYRSLFSQAGRNEITRFVSSVIGPLIEHCETTNRDLTRTLDIYLQQSRHHARTCSLLHIHANTLYQRLDRITQLLGAHALDADRSLELQLALRLHWLMSTVSLFRSDVS